MNQLSRLVRLWPLLLIPCAFAAPPVAIVGARAEIGDGTVVENATIILRDGKIVSITPGGAASEGATVVDAKGLTAYPGFIDAYATRGVTPPQAPALGTPLEYRTTAPPRMWEGNRAGIRPQLEAAEHLKLDGEDKQSLRQGLVAALVTPSVGIFRGRASVIGFGEKPITLRASVAQSLNYRGAATGAVGTGYPGTILGVIALARQTLHDARIYRDRQAAEPKPAKDEALEALLPVIAGEQPLLFEADTEREFDRAFLLSDDFKAKIIARGGRDAARRAAELKQRGIDVILRIDLPEAPPLQNTEARAEPVPEPILKERHDDWKRRMANARQLAASGVRFAFCTDGGIGDFLKNVRALITQGELPREAALRALTVDAAAILGISDRLGTLTVGKDASVVLMDGDFANPATKVVTVFAFGTRTDVNPQEAGK